MAPRSDEELLRAAWRSLGTVKAIDGWQVIQARPGGRSYAGVRFPSAGEGLLVGFNVDVPPDRDLPDGRGFSVECLAEPAHPTFQSWLALTRRSAASLDMFALMAADLLGTVEANGNHTGEAKLCSQFIARVRSWQKFMERPSDGRLTSEEEVGLFGELAFFRRCLDVGLAFDTILGLWVGPQNGLRDFAGEGFAIEIKSTAAVNGFPARIGSLEQLDDADGEQIDLVAQRLSLQETGSTLPEIIASLRLRVDAVSAAMFERKLVFAGYSDAHAGHYSRKFAIADTRTFRVSAEFPRLVRSSIPLAVRDAEYLMDLDLVDIRSTSVDDLIGQLSERV